MRGIDISKWQSGLNLADVDVAFMICKATEGVGYVDSTCARFVAQAKAKGIPWGYYHFARENDAAREAEDFYKATKDYTNQGIPVLDYEVWGKNSNDVKWCERFIERFHELSGVWCMLYTSASRCRDFKGSWIPDRCSLWLAGYPYPYTSWVTTNCPYDASPWKSIAIWQFTSSLRISGFNGNLDGDIAYIGKEGWAKIAGGSPSDEKYDIWLQSRTANKVLPAVHNNDDNAGIDAPMMYLSAWTEPGELIVQARTEKSGWLSKLTNPKNIKDPIEGSVGDGSPITGIRMFYKSPNGDKAVHYRVKTEKSGWLPWMIDHRDTGGSKDDFAGDGSRIQRIEAYIGGL